MSAPGIHDVLGANSTWSVEPMCNFCTSDRLLAMMPFIICRHTRRMVRGLVFRNQETVLSPIQHLQMLEFGFCARVKSKALYTLKGFALYST
jgi:hypothetical protein